MKYEIIYVKWYDAWCGHGWKDKSEYKKSDLGFPCETAGFKIFEDDKSIRIALSISEQNDTLADVLTIPKANIVKKEIIGDSENFKDEN